MGRPLRPVLARRNLIGEDERGGIQGYLKVSCVLLGPGDKPEIHEPDEEEDNSNDSAVLMPPALKRELMFLRVGVVKAKKLPHMDKTAFGGNKRGAAIQAYVEATFCGYTARTKVVESQDPGFHTEFWIPVLVPSVGAKLRIRVMDEDFGKADDEVGTFLVPFDPVLKEEAEVRVPPVRRRRRWRRPRRRARRRRFSRAGRRLRRQLKDNAKFYSSEWRGKLQLRLASPPPTIRTW